jgi:S1-C subfamily serine protease
MSVERDASHAGPQRPEETKATPDEALWVPSTIRLPPPALAAPIVEPPPLPPLARRRFAVLLLAFVLPALVVLALAAAWGLIPGVPGLEVLDRRRAADKALSPTAVGRIGKAATALLVAEPGARQGSACCINPSGLFLTTEPLAQGNLTLVLNPGLKTEQSLRAQVIRTDKDLGLALVRVEGARDLPVLKLGSDEKLEELMDVVAVGFPRVADPGPGPRRYPAVSLATGRITSLPRRDGQLDRIHLDAALDPGNGGGPVLDRSGKLIGIVVDVQAKGVHRAVPVSKIARFLTPPEIHFEPPLLGPSDIHQERRFEARVTPLLPSREPLTVDLLLKPESGPEQKYRMQARGDQYQVAAVPVPAPPSRFSLRLLAQFDDGWLSATAADRAFKVGKQEVKLSAVRGLRLGAAPHRVLQAGESLAGRVTGLEAVPVRLGEQTLAVNLARAVTVKVAPAAAIEPVSCTLVVSQGGKEIFRQSQGLTDQGLLKNPGFEAGLEGWSTAIIGARSRIEFDTDMAREGWQALRVTAADPSDTAIGQDVTLKPGQWYRFSGWVRTRGLDPRGSPVFGTFRIFHAGGGVIAGGTNHGGNTEWTEVQITFQAPAGGLTRIAAFFVGFGQGTGTAWFDDLKLAEVSPPHANGPATPGWRALRRVNGGYLVSIDYSWPVSAGM